MRPQPMTKLRCIKCAKRFLPNKKDTKLLNDGIRKRMNCVMVECSACGGLNFINPVALALDGSKKTGGTVREAKPLRCPVSGCSGWVNTVRPVGANKPFRGCGECGSVWRSESALFGAIQKIIRKYPYRKRSYREIAGAFSPTSLKQEIQGYEDLVEQEPKGRGRRQPSRLKLVE